MNRLQLVQLESWRRLRTKDKVTVLEFLKVQPKMWWLLQAFVAAIWAMAELSDANPYFLRAIVFAGFYCTVMIYLRTRLYWPIQRQFLDWSKIEAQIERERV